MPLEDYIHYQFPDFKIAHELTGGDTFGELALQHDVTRSATIICKTRCEFAILDREGK